MTRRTDDSWRECTTSSCTGIQLADSESCTGIQLEDGKSCLAHTTEEDREAALKAISESGIVDARGVPFSEALLANVLAAVPRDDNGKEVFKTSMFDRATFTGDVSFEGATFTGDASFEGVTFTGEAWFNDATFTADANFAWGTFVGDARFGATFNGNAHFYRATFNGDALFFRAAFNSDASFGWVTFNRDASFYQATFNRHVSYEAATFTGNVQFVEVSCNGVARFGKTRFEQAVKFGPLLAYGGLVLDDAHFAQRIQIDITTNRLPCRRARFPAGVQFWLRWARVVLDDTDIPAPSMLSGAPHLASKRLAPREEQFVQGWLQGGQISEQPQLLSMRRANIAGLGLSNITMTDCRLASAHNLDKLRLEASVTFAAAPERLGWLRWEGRQVIAEERVWRAEHRYRDWKAPPWPDQDWLGGTGDPDWLGDRPEALDAGQIADLYRALRKGREDAKDEPGAADFYYGEMEMRRQARTGTAARGRMERGLLTAYWLVSGYSLRAWRALAWLAVITALFAVAFHLIGFAKPPQPASYWTSLLYGFRATLSLTDSNVQLTAWGRLLQGLLRLTGPVLLGLALLALRGRVKR